MPATISVAMSKKTGPPKCETVIVHCTLEFDEDWPTLQNPESIQPFLHSAVVACREALHEEGDTRSWAPSVAVVLRPCAGVQAEH